MSIYQRAAINHWQGFTPVIPMAFLCVCALVISGCTGLAQDALIIEPLEQKGSGLQVELANSGYEQWNANGNCPTDWQCSQHAGEPSFVFLPEAVDRVDGTVSMKIERVGSQPWGSVRQTIGTEFVKGKSVRFSAEMKLRGVTGPGAGLMIVTRGGMKVSAPIYTKYVTGTSDWQTVELEGEIPIAVSRVTLGVIMEGDGVLLVDKVRLEILQSK